MDNNEPIMVWAEGPHITAADRQKAMELGITTGRMVIVNVRPRWWQFTKLPRHGPPGRRETPWVIEPTGHRRRHDRQHRRRGRRPREHQFRRTTTRAPPPTINHRRTT